MVHVFAASPLAPLVDNAIFSCRIGRRKPDAAAYAAAIAAMAASPERIAFGGDGSDEELSGAVAAGMRAALLRADLSASYDRDRVDVVGWHAPSVNSIEELVPILGQ